MYAETINTYIHRYIHTYIHKHAHTNICAYTYTRARTHPHTYAHTHTFTHAHSHAFTRTHKHAYAHAHTYTHAYTHKRSFGNHLHGALAVRGEHQRKRGPSRELFADENNKTWAWLSSQISVRTHTDLAERLPE